MKSNAILILLILLSFFSSAAAITTSRSLAFSDSYGLRALGSDALYWNPANLSSSHGSFDIPLVNFKFHVENNSLNIKTYNEVTGQFIDDALKEKILSGIPGHLAFEGNMHTTILGTTSGRIGFGIGLNAMGSGKLSKQYLDLLLYGNQADDEVIFTKQHNDAEGIIFSDLTIGSGDYELSRILATYLEHDFPSIKFGFSVSALTGLKGYKVSSFNGHFSATDDGINLQQDLVYNEGTLGFGYKGMIGFKAKPINRLDVGLTLDNILGQIRWSGGNTRHTKSISIDSLYVADLNNDIFNPTDSKSDMGPFTTQLPVEMNMCFLYYLNNGSISLDYRQGFSDSFITSKHPRIAMGAEYLPMKSFPLQFGFSLPNQLEPYRVSYGFGWKVPHFELGLSMQSSRALVPCNLSKGFAFALHSRILY